MWFVFPQLRGLGHSSAAQRYGIASLEEAQAYLAHPFLGERLERCTRAAQRSGSRTPLELFGFPDDLKFHASMTLFARASELANNPYERALRYWWDGEKHRETVRLLERQA